MDLGQVLLQAIDTGDLDLALTLGGAQKKTAKLLSELPLHWIASPGFRDRAKQPLPLALFDPPCQCQTPGLEALERSGRPWRVAMTSPSLMGLWAAVSAGLGLTARAELGLPADVQTIDLGLPPLGNIPITLHRRRGLRLRTRFGSQKSQRSWSRLIFVQARATSDLEPYTPVPQPGWMVFQRKVRRLGGQQSRQRSLEALDRRSHVALETILVKLCL